MKFSLRHRKVFTVAVVVLLLASVFCGLWQLPKQAKATTIFSDGFECPPNTAPSTFTAWTGVVGDSGGYSIIQSTIKHSGTYAAKFFGTTTDCEVIETFSGTASFCVDGFFQFGSLPTSGNSVEIYHSSGGTDARAFLANVGGVYEWELRDGSTGSIVSAATPNPTTGVWYEVEMDTFDGGNRQLWVDGTKILDLGNSAGESWTTVYVGSMAKADSLTIYLDDVTFATTHIQSAPSSGLTAQADHDYTLATNSTSNYVIAQNGTFMYNNAAPELAYATMLSYIANGGTYYVKAGTYTATNQGWNGNNFAAISINNTIGTWETGAIFTIGNWLNTSVLILKNANNNTFTNLTINGNGFTDNTHATPLQTATSSGWVVIDGNYNVLQNATIYNVKRDGVQVFESSPSETGNNNTVRFCNITYVGWNSITFGGQSPNTPTNIYCGYNNASFNYCAHNGDLGISLYGYYDIAANNTVEDMLGVGGALNSMWGIASEDGGYNWIANNTVFHVKTGINVDSETSTTGNYTIVENNNVTNCAIGIAMSKSFNIARNNIVKNCSGDILPNYSHVGLGVFGGYNNTFQNNIVTCDANCDPSLPIYIAGASHAYILNNTVTTNVSVSLGVGVNFESGSNAVNNIIIGNNIQAKNGVTIPSSDIANNFFQENNLSNCTTPITNSGTNTTLQGNTGLGSGYKGLTLSTVGSGVIGWTQGTSGISTQTTTGAWQFSANTNVSVTWTPNAGNSRLDFSLDGSNQSTTTSPQTVNMTGDHTVIAYFSISVSVTVVSPTATTYVVPNVNVELSASGGTIDKRWFKLVASNGTVIVGNTTYTAITQITGLTDATYTFTAYANNTLGTEGSATVTFTIVIGNTYPISVSILNPTNSTYSASTIPVSFSASTNGTVQTELWNVMNGTNWVYATNQSFIITSMSGFTNGSSYVFYAWANNTQGYNASASVGFSVLAYLYYTNNITINAPTNTTYNQPSTTIVYSISNSGNDTGFAYQIQAYYGNGTTLWVSNQTTPTGSMDNLSNDSLTFCVSSVGDNGAIDYKTVAFTTYITQTTSIGFFIISITNAGFDALLLLAVTPWIFAVAAVIRSLRNISDDEPLNPYDVLIPIVACVIVDIAIMVAVVILNALSGAFSIW